MKTLNIILAALVLILTAGFASAADCVGTWQSTCVGIAEAYCPGNYTDSGGSYYQCVWNPVGGTCGAVVPACTQTGDQETSSSSSSIASSTSSSSFASSTSSSSFASSTSSSSYASSTSDVSYQTSSSIYASSTSSSSFASSTSSSSYASSTSSSSYASSTSSSSYASSTSSSSYASSTSSSSQQSSSQQSSSYASSTSSSSSVKSMGTISSSVYSSSSSSSSRVSSIASSTLPNYVTRWDSYIGNGVINDTLTVRNQSANYTWGLEVYGYNITSVKVGNLAVYRDANSSAWGNGRWYWYGTPQQVGVFEDYCTLNVRVNMTSRNATGGLYTNSTIIQSNITALPCVSSGNNATTTTFINDTTLILDYTTAGSYTTVVYMTPVTHNSTHKYCPYAASNTTSVTMNLTATANADIDKCSVSLTKGVEDGPISVVTTAGYLATETPRGGVATTLGAGLVVVVMIGIGIKLLRDRQHK